MYYRIRNSADAVIVLSEIYGITAPIRSACNTFYDAGFDAISPNYLSLPRSLEIHEEQLAYEHFTSVGFSSARDNVRTLIDRLRPHYNHIFIAGYSVGATTAWLLSSEENLCDGITAFYGSRIREHAAIEPKSPALLIFPRTEHSFDTHALARTLAENECVTTSMYEGEHGFADHRSPRHHEASTIGAHREAVHFFNKVAKDSDNTSLPV
ncbi:MAG TPA: dienelactone hydrolase family protein [Spirochaetota bacterium]